MPTAGRRRIQAISDKKPGGTFCRSAAVSARFFYKFGTMPNY
jgi:hypothetical protein